jgi:beta-lactam-binding protein with PASTA domain
VTVPDLVTVPNLEALSVVAANAQLKAFNLIMKSVGVVSTDGGKGEVVGPNFTRLPTGLVGMTYDQAVAALKTANLTITQQVVDSTAPLDTVVKVIGVKAGAQVSEGTRIVLQTSNNHLFVVRTWPA